MMGDQHSKLKDSIQKILNLHIYISNFYSSKVQEDLGLEVLPTDFGGTNASLSELRDYWIDQMERNRKVFDKSKKYYIIYDNDMKLRC